MYRKDDKKQNIRHMNFIFDDVGLGDCIAALPALKYIYDNFPHMIAHVWVPDYFYDIAIRSLPNDKKRMPIKPMSRATAKFNNQIPGRSFKLYNHIALATHPSDTAFMAFVNRQVDDSLKNYIQFDTSDQDIKKFNLPEKYVVITVNYTASVRQFLPEYVNKVVDFCKEKGYDVVFLGKEEAFNGFNHTIKGELDEKIDLSKGINLINKTSILETTEIIKHAACIVGLDNGLLHLAGTTNVPIVAGYTTVEPSIRMPYRNSNLGHGCFPVAPPKSLDCRFCQSNWNLTLGHDFKECFYGDRKCVYELKPELYIEELKKIL